MEGLEFFTSEELIHELMSRSTFAGIILYSSEQQIMDNQIHNNFHCITKAEPEDTAKILINAAKTVSQEI